MLHTKNATDSPVSDSEVDLQRRAAYFLKICTKSNNNIPEIIDRLLSHFQQNLNWFQRKPWIPHDNTEIQAQLYFIKLNFYKRAEDLKSKTRDVLPLLQKFFDDYNRMYLLLRSISDTYRVARKSLTHIALDSSPSPPSDAARVLSALELDSCLPFSPNRDGQSSYSPLFFPFKLFTSGEFLEKADEPAGRDEFATLLFFNDTDPSFVSDGSEFVKPPSPKAHVKLDLTLNLSALELNQQEDDQLHYPCIARHSEANKNIFL